MPTCVRLMTWLVNQLCAVPLSNKRTLQFTHVYDHAPFCPSPFRFYTSFASLMSYKYKEVFEAAAEVIGLLLAYLDSQQHVRAAIRCTCGPQKSWSGIALLYRGVLIQKYPYTEVSLGWD